MLPMSVDSTDAMGREVRFDFGYSQPSKQRPTASPFQVPLPGVFTGSHRSDSGMSVDELLAYRDSGATLAYRDGIDKCQIVEQTAPYCSNRDFPPLLRPGLLCSPNALKCSCLCCFFGRANAHELVVKQQIVENLECPCDEERHVDQRTACKQKTDQDRSHSSSNRTSYASNSRCCRSFFWTNNSHQVRLPGRHIHLADAEA